MFLQTCRRTSPRKQRVKNPPGESLLCMKLNRKVPLVHPIRGHSQCSVVNLHKLSACRLFRSLSENPFQHTALPAAHRNRRSQPSIHESRARCSHASGSLTFPRCALREAGGPTPHQHLGTQVRLSSAGGTRRSAGTLEGSGELSLLPGGDGVSPIPPCLLPHYPGVSSTNQPTQSQQDSAGLSLQSEVRDGAVVSRCKSLNAPVAGIPIFLKTHTGNISRLT